MKSKNLCQITITITNDKKVKVEKTPEDFWNKIANVHAGNAAIESLDFHVKTMKSLARVLKDE